MPRRQLRKIDPRLDLTHFLKVFDELPDPWDANALFGREAPLQVEVGSGKGLFIQNAAIASPGHNFLGVEVAGKYARFCAARLAKHALTNAVMVHGDALRLFTQLFPDNWLTAVHVYFPDPWWKKRHHKRRVMAAAFVRHVERVLIAGGRLHFWTDVRDYFDASVDLLAAETSLTADFAVAEQPPEHDLDFRTHFERRTRLAGEQVFRGEFVKSPRTHTCDWSV